MMMKMMILCTHKKQQLRHDKNNKQAIIKVQCCIFDAHIEILKIWQQSSKQVISKFSHSTATVLRNKREVNKTTSKAVNSNTSDHHLDLPKIEK